MRSIHDWFAEYSVSHQNHTNKAIHYICVPAIFFSVIGLLASIPAGFLQSLVPPAFAPFAHWGTVVIILGLLFYLRLSFAVFVGMLVVCVLSLLGNYYLARLNILPLWIISLFIFAVAWVGQFIGHKIEGKKPSFLKDLAFLLIGPAWILGFVYRKLRIKY